jgi:transcriptional regulator with XRE-family HTH domain
MFVRTPAELGAVIRDRRKQLKLNQSTFAKKIGVSRQWVIEIERGHARAELGLALRALGVLDINLDVSIDQAKVWIPIYPAMHSDMNPATYSDFKPATVPI